MKSNGQSVDNEAHLLPSLIGALNEDPKNYDLRRQIVAAMGELGFRNHALPAALKLSEHLILQVFFLPALSVLCESKAYHGFSSPLIQEKIQLLHSESAVDEDKLLGDALELGDLRRETIDDLEPSTLEGLPVEEQVVEVAKFLEEPAIHSARGIPVPMPLFSEMTCEQFMTPCPT